MLRSMRIVLHLGFFVGVLSIAASLSPSEANAEEPSAYARNCESCHGKDGRAATPIGTALKIPSFTGSKFTGDQIKTLLREGESHARMGIELDEQELDALVTFLNALASAP